MCAASCPALFAASLCCLPPVAGGPCPGSGLRRSRSSVPLNLLRRGWDGRVPVMLHLHRLFHCTLLQSQADPNYKLIAAAYPYMARRLLTDPAPELR